MYSPFLWEKEANFITLHLVFLDINKWVLCKKNKYDLKMTFKVVQTEYVYKINPKSIKLYINKSILMVSRKIFQKKVIVFSNLLR